MEPRADAADRQTVGDSGAWRLVPGGLFHCDGTTQAVPDGFAGERDNGPAGGALGEDLAVGVNPVEFGQLEVERRQVDQASGFLKLAAAPFFRPGEALGGPSISTTRPLRILETAAPRATVGYFGW